MRLYNATPQVGLEPTTLRLRLILCFHKGADYLINFLLKVAGRLWGLIGGGSSTPSLCTFLTTVCCEQHLPFRQASLRITVPARGRFRLF